MGNEERRAQYTEIGELYVVQDVKHVANSECHIRTKKLFGGVLSVHANITVAHRLSKSYRRKSALLDGTVLLELPADP